MRFGAWNVWSLYRAGSLTAAARELARYEVESKSKGRIHLMALIEVTVSNFTYIIFLHNAFVISFN